MKKYFKYIIILLLIISLFIIIKPNKNNKKTESVKNTQIKKEESITTKLQNKYNNKDILGTISIEGTDINEVLLQSKDNKYYLKHDNYGNPDKYGSVFLDYRCNKDSKKILIFGHNDFKEETPFSNLENYYEEEYFKKNQFIEVIINDEKMKYQIFSVYIEPEDFTYMNLKIDDNQYAEDLIKYKKKSFYDTKVSVDKEDDILILQTCSNHKDYKKYQDKYLLIIAKKV